VNAPPQGALLDCFLHTDSGTAGQAGPQATPEIVLSLGILLIQLLRCGLLSIHRGGQLR
jgi:hypothetical protein